MINHFKIIILGICLFCLTSILFAQTDIDIYGNVALLNQKDDGFRGIWYKIGSLDNEYKFKYGGGLATYPANLYPFSVYVPEVNKTFFCYGGTDETNSTLLHEVSYFDHTTGEVARPTIVLDKATNDAHDNPVIQVDKDGYIWVFSTSHGIERPSFIHRSVAPYSIKAFERIPATKIENGIKVPMDNFSYLQIYYDIDHGFLGLFTFYQRRELPGLTVHVRNSAWMTSPDGIQWSEWNYLAFIEQGHYQSSGQQGTRVGTSFNYHPNRKERAGLDYRTNLYCLITEDFGETWKTARGDAVDLPLTTINNDALVYDYSTKGLNVYISDLNFDNKGNPVILYLTSSGPDAGPENGPRQWYTACWTGAKWRISPVTTSDSNYDAGSVYTESNPWRIVASTEVGPQPYNTGGEVAIWESHNRGKSWKMMKQITSNSEFNHSYMRRPVNVHPDFYAFWADGHGREKSISRLYFCDIKGNVYQLPEKMDQEFCKPLLIELSDK